MATGEPTGSGPTGELSPQRVEAAIRFVQQGLAVAEERYLVEPSASLGTWFARAQETIAIAALVTLRRIEEGWTPTREEMLAEQLGLHVDICAETVRAAARVQNGCAPARAREEIVRQLPTDGAAAVCPIWGDLAQSILRCGAALEPIANGLREKDLPMGPPTDTERVARCFLEAARAALGVVYALSG